EARVGLAEGKLDGVHRYVRAGPAVAQVFHVAAVVLVERMEDRVLATVELQRPDAEFLAKGEGEGGRCLYPPSVEVQVGVAVVDEEVASHRLGEPRRRQVVLHVREAHARRDPGGAGASGEEGRLADAEPLAGRQYRRRVEYGGVGKVEER